MSDRKRTRKELNDDNETTNCLQPPQKKLKTLSSPNNKVSDKESESARSESESNISTENANKIDDNSSDDEEEYDEFGDVLTRFYNYQNKYDIQHNIDERDYSPSSYIYKLARNRSISSGEGGYNPGDMNGILYWDIWACPQLDVDKNRIYNLRQDLIELSIKQNDWREGEPVLNIIDPDLYVYKLFQKKTWTETFKPIFDKVSKCWMDDDNDKQRKWNQLLENEQKGYFQRTSYQWLATEFEENKQTNKISITSNIHNLSPRNKYENIYKGIEYVFERMLPLFNKYKAFKNREKNSFQVIIRSQRYCIEDGTGFKGHWHKEGLSENIICGGLYYFDKDPLLEGGCLKFRNLYSPITASKFYYNDMNENNEKHYNFDMYEFPAVFEVQHSAAIKEGTCVVFDNINTVHRVRSIKNKVGDGKKRYRSFIAFFIVDPMKKTNISTKYYPTLKREDFVKIIMEYGCNELSEELAISICEYGRCGVTLNEAKEIRKKDIELRKNEKTKAMWGTCFGNGGVSQIFYRNGQANIYEHEILCDDFHNTTNSGF